VFIVIETLVAKWDVASSLMPFLMQGLWITFEISILAILFGSILGFILGVIRSLNYRISSAIIGFYLHIFRGSPYLVQIYIIYFVLPSLDIEFLKFDSFTAAIVSLSLYTSSYVTEITNSAINTVPKGQAEAARSCGMSKLQALYYVVVPQSFKLMIPPMAGVYVIIIKNTAILSVIGISELTRQGEVAILRLPGDIMFIYTLIAIMYFIYCYPILRFSSWAEKKYGSIDMMDKR
jgi:polar amino acid transport system permease protein